MHVLQGLRDTTPAAAHKAFRCANSDTLSAVNALLAFQSVAPAEEQRFCATSHLHVAPMREMRNLHQQLLRLLHRPAQHAGLAQCAHKGAALLSAGLDDVLHVQHGSANALAPPKEKHQRLLRRCIAAAWPDQIARRITPRERLARQIEQARRRYTCTGQLAAATSVAAAAMSNVLCLLLVMAPH